ncbi:MAG: SLC13 family permease [Alphaproteobacteria bacterium]
MAIKARTGPLSRAVAGAAVVAAAVLLAWPSGDPMPLRAGALLVFAVGLWASGALPVPVTAIGFFLGAVLLAIAPAPVVFSGFASTAFWLVFGGLIVGLAVERTGLGQRLAGALVRIFAGGYLRVVVGVVMVGLVLAFLMPSTMGRVIVLVPIVAALADRLGYPPGTRGRDGIVMATALGTFMPAAAILPANVANMVMTGAAETLYGVHVRYMEYLILHFPVLGLLKTGFVVAVVWLLYRDPSVRPVAALDERGADCAPRRAWTRDEHLLAVILVLTLIAWALDSWHGLSPAWVALAAGFLCLLPGITLVPTEDFERKMNWGSLVYVAGILGLAAVIDHAGLGRVLANALVAATGLEQDAAARNFAALVAVGTLLSMATTIGGLPGVLSPLAEGVAAASGLPLKTVLMTQVLGFSTVILPYQLPPLVVAMQLGGVSASSGARATLALAAITLAALMPLNFFWWRALGYLG